MEVIIYLFLIVLVIYLIYLFIVYVVLPIASVIGIITLVVSAGCALIVWLSSFIKSFKSTVKNASQILKPKKKIIL